MKTLDKAPKSHPELVFSRKLMVHIPLDLYKPVAEIIGYVMRLKRGQRVRYSSMRGRE
jgi:type III secretion system FlhB-like substrate exporter